MPHWQVLCIPSGAGGEGRKGVHEFYANRFIPNIPADIELIPISEIFGQDQLVEEMVVRFTHSLRMDWMLPGLPPAGCKVEFLLVVVMGFESGKLASEHIYWDQATVLSRIITIGSNAPVRTAFAGASVYSMTKGAVAALICGVAIDLAPRGLPPTTSSPGPLQPIWQLVMSNS
jgi:hypothetical protein